jgi:hypothetical protein
MEYLKAKESFPKVVVKVPAFPHLSLKALAFPHWSVKALAPVPD